jgi:hypothetical protein
MDFSDGLKRSLDNVQTVNLNVTLERFIQCFVVGACADSSDVT